MPWVDYSELRRRLDMEEVLSWMDWRANVRKGEYLRGSCPLCGESKSPRARNFVVHISRKLFKCFRCNAGGDVLVLWSKHRKTKLIEAANELQSRLKAH